MQRVCHSLLVLTWMGILVGAALSACGQGSVPPPTSVATADRQAAQAIVDASTPTRTLAPGRSATPTPRPTDTVEPVATATVALHPAATLEPTPTATPTLQPTFTPEPTPVPTPVSLPTFTPRPPPTATPIPTPTPDLKAASQAGSTGTTPPGMETYDRRIPDLMEKWGVPGGAIAVVQDGRLVFAKGYGLADVENEELVQPDSLFRIASISKPVTGVAILKLREDGLLDLDERAFDILDHLEPPGGEILDPRIREVTVRQLLHHSGGWDRGASYDPMFISERVAARLGVEPPVVCQDVIRFMLGQRLDFEPGTQYAYSNFGYCILGRIIEKKTGQPYEEYVRENILAPAAITRMQVGRTRPEERAAGEVKYYQYPGAKLTNSVFADGPQRVSRPYGGFYLEALDSHGGWIASPIDLARLVTALDGSGSPTVLRPESVEIMVARPNPPLRDTSRHYGMGWSIRPKQDDANWWHAGSLPGTRTLLVRTHHGGVWAAFFNSRPEARSEFGSELDKTMWLAFREVTTWPEHDLFPLFGYE